MQLGKLARLRSSSTAKSVFSTSEASRTLGYARTSRKWGEPLVYFVSNLLFANGRDLRPLPVIERKARLRRLIPKRPSVPAIRRYVETEGEFMFAHAVSIGREGVSVSERTRRTGRAQCRSWLDRNDG